MSSASIARRNCSGATSARCDAFKLRRIATREPNAPSGESCASSRVTSKSIALNICKAAPAKHVVDSLVIPIMLLFHEDTCTLPADAPKEGTEPWIETQPREHPVPFSTNSRYMAGINADMEACSPCTFSPSTRGTFRPTPFTSSSPPSPVDCCSLNSKGPESDASASALAPSIKMNCQRVGTNPSAVTMLSNERDEKKEQKNRIAESERRFWTPKYKVPCEGYSPLAGRFVLFGCSNGFRKRSKKRCCALPRHASNGKHVTTTPSTHPTHTHNPRASRFLFSLPFFERFRAVLASPTPPTSIHPKYPLAEAPTQARWACSRWELPLPQGAHNPHALQATLDVFIGGGELETTNTSSPKPGTHQTDSTTKKTAPQNTNKRHFVTPRHLFRMLLAQL